MSEFTAEVRALTIEFGQNLFSFFREIFQTPSSQLTDKLATVYSLALTGDDSGDFSTDAFANNNMFDAINTLVTNTPYPGLKSTIPKIKSLLDGYGEQHLGFEEALRDVRTEKDIQLADTFKNKITAKFINSIVSGSGIQDMDIDVFGSDESGLRSAYNNMLSYITTDRKSVV